MQIRLTPFFLFPASCRLLLSDGHLHIIDLPEQAGLPQQLLRRAALEDLSVLQHQNIVAVHECRDAVGNDDGRRPGQIPVQRLADVLVRLRVDGGQGIVEDHHRITPNDRKVTVLARQKEEETGEPALALELQNGEMVTGKTSYLFGPTAALLINAIKKLAHIDKETKLIEPEYVQPIQGLKINHLGSRNPRLHSNEILIALAITAMTNEDAKLAMQELGKLKGSEAHSTVMLTDEDKNVLRKLGINVTMDPVYQYDRLYRK